MSFYDEIGGESTIAAIARGFYARVATDPVLLPLYPERDLAPAQRRLELFLAQYWGGPTTYSEERGHPRLRMRHMPYVITPEVRDHWLSCMLGAIDGAELDTQHHADFVDYVTRAADAMINARG